MKNDNIALFSEALNIRYPQLVKTSAVALALEYLLTQEQVEGNEILIQELDAACRRQSLGLTRVTPATFEAVAARVDF